MRIAEDLAFDVAGALDELFQIDLVLAEGGHGLALGFGHLAGEIASVADGAHAAPAAAPGGLQHHGIADLLRPCLATSAMSSGSGSVAGHDGNADGNGEIARRDLVAELAHRIGPRADEDDAGLVAGIDEFRALRQQAVARMDRIGTGKLGDADHLVDRQIALDRPQIAGKMRAAADLIALVGLEAVQRQLVFFRPYRDRFYPELVGRAKHADGNFGTVGNKDLRYGQCSLLTASKRAMLHPRREVLTCCHGKFNFPRHAPNRISLRLGNQPMPEGDSHRLLPVLGLQLVLQAVHVPVDGMVGNLQTLADLHRGHAFREILQYFHLAAGQAACRCRRPLPASAPLPADRADARTPFGRSASKSEISTGERSTGVPPTLMLPRMPFRP